MADSNNNLAGSISTVPNVALKKLDKLSGRWQVSGSFIEGVVEFSWLDGGFFLVQQVDLHREEHSIKVSWSTKTAQTNKISFPGII